MKVVGIERYLPSEDGRALIDAELPDPIPKGRDILVQVKAISVNPVDTKVRRGRAQPLDKVEDPVRVIGWDASGTVVSVGEGVTFFGPGD